MSEITVKSKPEITRNYITNLLNQLSLDYQAIQSDKKAIAVNFPANEDEFSVLEEIELLTVDIRGYASQIKVKEKVENHQEAKKRLQGRRFFDVTAIAELYFNTNDNYRSMKAYLRMLDYLRLLSIEYLDFEFNF